jgi:hypothetical protein
MIYYNMRYRGAYEYEKFLLNILQYTNMINSFVHDTENTDSWETLKQLQEDVDALYNQSTCNKGLSEQIYRRFIMLKEGK